MRLARLALGVALLGTTLLGCTGSPAQLVLTFDTHKHLFASIREADRITLYEGLPAAEEEEGKLLEQERETKATVTLRSDLFYASSLPVKQADLEPLRTILGDSSRFQSHRDWKCDYHADYCLEWSSAGTVHRCHLCFGCSQAKIYTPSGGMLFTVPGDTRIDLARILRPYRVSRPGNPKWF